jgi:D-alanyl-D-alanine carboxypeptidase
MFHGGDVIVPGRIQGIALGCVTRLLLSCITAQSSALKPIDPAALQGMVDATAKELLIPGAVVLLRTPQGDFAVTYGTTMLGEKSPPRPDTYFRVASNTKTMTAVVILQLAQEGKLTASTRLNSNAAGTPGMCRVTRT